MGDVPNLAATMKTLVQQRMQRAAHVAVAPLRTSFRAQLLHLPQQAETSNAWTFLKAGLILTEKPITVLGTGKMGDVSNLAATTKTLVQQRIQRAAPVVVALR